MQGRVQQTAVELFTDSQFVTVLGLGLLLPPMLRLTGFWQAWDFDEALNLWWIINFCVLMPIVEELIFRDVFHRWLHEQWRGFAFKSRLSQFLSPANIFTSLIFASLHLMSQPWQWAAMVIVPSLIFGYFFERHNSVLPCIKLHSAFNSAFFLAHVA